MNASEFIFAQEVVQEDKILEERQNRFWLKLIFGVVFILLVVFVTLLVTAGGVGPSRSVNNGAHSPQLFVLADLFPLNGTLPAKGEICRSYDSGMVEKYPPIVQCYCGGKMNYFPIDALQSYYNLSQTLIKERIIAMEPDPTDCSNPLSVGILWLMLDQNPKPISIPVLVRRYILSVFFHSLDGLIWTRNTFWLSTWNECLWFGVSCDINNNVSKIELPDNRLYGSIPEQIGFLQDLQVLDLSLNKALVGTIPSTLSSLPRLETLNVSGTSLHKR